LKIKNRKWKKCGYIFSKKLLKMEKSREVWIIDERTWYFV
jgi:hypothetical protein